MSTYPTERRSDFLAWCQVHDPVFQEQGEDIGLSPPMVADFTAAMEAAQAALLAQAQAQEAALAATAAAKAAVKRLRETAGRTVRTIRAYAQADKQPSAIYVAAKIAPPAPAAPAPPPDQPRNLSATLTAATGALTLRWQARNPEGTSGTVYTIERKLPGETAFRFIGLSGRKRFVDETLPAGTTQAQYSVQGHRGKKSGPASHVLTVLLGASPPSANAAAPPTAATQAATALASLLSGTIGAGAAPRTGRTSREAVCTP